MSRGLRVAAHCPGTKAKPGYRTPRRARHARDRALAAQIKNGETPHPLWTYRCPLCGWWHITSQPPHERDADGHRIEPTSHLEHAEHLERDQETRTA